MITKITLQKMKLKHITLAKYMKTKNRASFAYFNVANNYN